MSFIQSYSNIQKIYLNQRLISSLMVVCVLFIAFYTEHSEASKTSVVPVSVQTVVFEKVSRPIIASGPVRPISEQSLAFKVSGIVGQVFVKEGQVVKKGQPLAKLVLEEINANVDKAEAILSDANRQNDRITTLTGQNMMSDQEKRQAETALEVAKADLRIAKFNRKYAVITAPENGRILTRNIEPNELVQAGQQTFVFADDSKGWSVKLAVVDIDVVKINLNDQALIKLDAYPNRVFTGVVQEIAGRADIHSQTFEVDVMFTKDQLPKLYSGLIAHTDITPNYKQTVTQLPLSAFIQANGQQGSVYLVSSASTVKLQTVEISYLSGAYAMISSGLKEGDRVVVEGGPFIVKGTEISIMNSDDLVKVTQIDSQQAELLK
ncbi:MAG: RND family efflux transporter MFP subunit [Bermanella sp.]|jgi:RND family efflux transporter MFP subunit